jgi:hypothetical protein
VFGDSNTGLSFSYLFMSFLLDAEHLARRYIIVGQAVEFLELCHGHVVGGGNLG